MTEVAPMVELQGQDGIPQALYLGEQLYAELEGAPPPLEAPGSSMMSPCCSTRRRSRPSRRSPRWGSSPRGPRAHVVRHLGIVELDAVDPHDVRVGRHMDAGLDALAGPVWYMNQSLPSVRTDVTVVSSPYPCSARYAVAVSTTARRS